MNKIRTKSINICNLCVPCCCHCRYCLLSYEGKLVGVDYFRGLNYAKRFKKWLSNVHPDVNFMYYFGYSIETPNLLKSIDDLKEVNSVMTSFLQFNGLNIRQKDELEKYLQEIKANGIKLIDITFYGLKDSHDKFAGRKGDFDYLMQIVEYAKKIELNFQIGVAVTGENLNELEDLISILEKFTNNIRLFVPHCGGRGKYIENIKISKFDYEKLSDRVKKYFNRESFKTISEWNNSKLSEVKERVLSLSLLSTNIDELENQSFEKTYQSLEKLDEDFYSNFPSLKELLNMYKGVDDDSLYSKKGVYAYLRRRYIEDNNLDIQDIDERFSYSVRI